MVRVELDRVELGRSVLEYAPGTGWWTAELAKRAGSVTVVDSAPVTCPQERQNILC